MGTHVGKKHHGRGLAGPRQNSFQGFAKSVGAVLELGAQKRMADDAKRKPVHLVAHIDNRWVVRPTVGGFRRELGHDFGKGDQAPVVEGRLNQLALAPPERPFAGDKSVTQRHAENVVAGALFVIVAIFDQDVADIFGAVCKHQRIRSDAHSHGVPVGTGRALEEAQRIAAKGQKAPQNGQTGWAGGEVVAVFEEF